MKGGYYEEKGESRSKYCEEIKYVMMQWREISKKIITIKKKGNKSTNQARRQKLLKIKEVIRKTKMRGGAV